MTNCREANQYLRRECRRGWDLKEIGERRGSMLRNGLTGLTLLALAAAASGQVVLREDFESGVLGEKWERYRDDPVRGGVETRPEYVHSGKYSYRISAPAFQGEGKSVGGRVLRESDSYIRTWFLPGYDNVYIRWYAKFAEDFGGRGMHWIQVWACRPDKPRSVLGGAGRRPDGTDRFIVNVEPRGVDSMPPPGQVVFYTYWPDMKASPDGRYWGNYFYPKEPFWIERGRWYGFELLIQCNEPGKSDGKQVLWIDGKEVLRTEGMRWRDVESLKVNMAMFGNYSSNSEHDRTYWLDDVVISSAPVGLLNRAAGKR